MPIPCPRCIRGQMFVDRVTSEAECLQCGCKIGGNTHLLHDDGMRSNFMMRAGLPRMLTIARKPIDNFHQQI